MVKMIRICDVIKGKYIVPDFQRDYTWGWKNLKLVIDDIKEACERNKDKYILGPIVIKEKDGEKKVIDGQQRLTSLLIILKAIKIEDSCFLGFENREHVEKLFGNIEGYDDNNPTCIKIWQMYAGAKTYISSFDREEFSTYLLNNVVFIKKSLRTDNIAHAFEVLNTAGEQLKKEDIAKAKLIARMAGLGLEKESELLNWAWLVCYDNENDLSTEMKKKREDIYRAEDLSSLYDSMKEFISIEGECVKTRLMDVVESVEKGKAYSRVIGGKIKDFQSGEYSVSLTPYELIDTALMDENSIGKSIRDIVSGESSILEDEDSAFKVIKSLLLYRIAFDEYVVKRHKGCWDWCVPVSHDEKYAERIIKIESMMAVSGTAASKAMLKIAKDSSFSLSSHDNIELTIIEKLERYAVNRIKREYISNDYDASDSSNDEDILKKFDDGTGTSHFVFHWLDYLLYLNPTEAIKKKADVFNFVETSSVEHFMPQHPIVGKLTEEWENELDNFGNLALITPSSNSRQNNSSPREKADLANDKTPESLKYELMMAIARETGWREEDSAKHGLEMKKLIKNSLEGHASLLIEPNAE